MKGLPLLYSFLFWAKEILIETKSQGVSEILANVPSCNLKLFNLLFLTAQSKAKTQTDFLNYKIELQQLSLYCKARLVKTSFENLAGFFFLVSGVVAIFGRFK